MRNQGRATTEHRRPISLDDTDKYPNLNVLVNMYQKCDHYVYSNRAKNFEFKFCTIIMKVSLEFSENQRYNLTITDKKIQGNLPEPKEEMTFLCLEKDVWYLLIDSKQMIHRQLTMSGDQEEQKRLFSMSSSKLFTS